MTPAETNLPPEQVAKEKRQMARLVRRFGTWHPLRRAIDRQTGEVQDTPQTVQMLLNFLRDIPETQWRERLLAAQAFGYVNIPPELRAEASSVLGKALLGRQTSFRRRIGWRILQWFLRTVVGSLFVVPVMLAGAILWDPSLKWLTFDFLKNTFFFSLPYAGFLMALFSPIYDDIRAMQGRTAVGLALFHQRLPESIGPLAKAAQGNDQRAKYSLHTLALILSDITEEHYGRLGPDATPELCALLHSEMWRRYVVEDCLAMKAGILTALEKAGDGRAVEPLQAYIAKEKLPELRGKAESILPTLEARREREKNSNMLLRGSNAPQTQPAELLRPTAYSSTTEPEQLLRATLGPQSAAQKEES